MELYQAVNNHHYRRVSQARQQQGLPAYGLLKSESCRHLLGKSGVIDAQNRFWRLAELFPEWVHRGWCIRGRFVRSDGAAMSLLVHNVNCEDNYAEHLVNSFEANYRWAD